MKLGMDYKEARKRILAAEALLLEPTTTREKFSSVRALIFGIHPGIDKTLVRVEEGISALEKVMGGEVIHLTAEHLPENTEDERKRKRALLLFLNAWKDLKGEVVRIGQESDAAKRAPTSGEKASHVRRIFNFAKGPFGITTIVALGAVIALQSTSVKISIRNQGCGTMQASASVPVPLPGLSLPSDPLPSGGTVVATIPPLTVDVDGTQEGVLTLRALNFTMTFELPDDTSDVTMNGASLLGKKSTIRLREHKEHSLILICS